LRRRTSGDCEFLQQQPLPLVFRGQVGTIEGLAVCWLLVSNNDTMHSRLKTQRFGPIRRRSGGRGSSHGHFLVEQWPQKFRHCVVVFPTYPKFIYLAAMLLCCDRVSKAAGNVSLAESAGRGTTGATPKRAAAGASTQRSLSCAVRSRTRFRAQHLLRYACGNGRRVTRDIEDDDRKRYAHCA
jgi:hypothetical protein